MNTSPDGMKLTDDLERELIAREIEAQNGWIPAIKLPRIHRSIADFAVATLLLAGTLVIGVLVA